MTSTGENPDSAQGAQFREQIDLLQGLAASEGCLDSPIDLDARISKQIQLQKLAWYNYNLPPKKMKVTNTGHTVVLSAKWFAERPFLARGPLLDNYVFSQVHFHWGTSDDEGSEHTVDQTRYPLEMHTVHFKSDYGSQDEALREKDGLFVLGSFFEIQDEDNPNLEFLVNALEHITRPHSSHNVALTPLSDVIRLFEYDYLLYWGSVMTSQCRHQILWAFSREPIGISSLQVAKFHQILGQNGKPLVKSPRPVHPLAGRTLFHVNASDYTSSTLLPFANRLRNSSQNISRLGPSYVDQLGGASFNQTQSVYLTDQTTRSIFHARTAYEDNVSDGSDEVCSTTDIMTQMPSVKTVNPATTFPSSVTVVSRAHIPENIEAELRTAVQPLFAAGHKQTNPSRKSATARAKSDDEYEDAVESFDELKLDGELELDDIPYQDTDEINRSVRSMKSVRTDHDEGHGVNDGANRSVKSKRSVKSNVEETDGTDKSVKSKRSTKSKADIVDDGGNKSVKSKKSAKNEEIVDIMQPTVGTNKSVKSRKSLRNDDGFGNGNENEIATRMMKSEKSLNGDEYSMNDDDNIKTSKSKKSRRSVTNNEDDSELNQENVIASKSVNSSSRKSAKSKVNLEGAEDQDDDAAWRREPTMTIRLETDDETNGNNEEYENKSNYSTATENRDSDDFDTNDDGSEMNDTSEDDVSDNDLDRDSLADDDELDEDARSVVTDKSAKSLEDNMTGNDGTNKSKKSKKSLKEQAGDLDAKSKKSVNDETEETRSVKSKKTIKNNPSELDGKSKKSRNNVNEDSPDFEVAKSMKSKKSIKSNIAGIDATNKSVKSSKSSKSKREEESYEKDSVYNQTFKNSPSVYVAQSIANTLPKESVHNSMPLATRPTVEFSSRLNDTRSYSVDNEDNVTEVTITNKTLSSASVVTGSVGTIGLRPSYVSSEDDSDDESVSASSRSGSRVTEKASRKTDAASKLGKSAVGLNGVASSDFTRKSNGTASIGISEGDSHTMLDRSIAPSKLFSDVDSDESDDETGSKSEITLKTQTSTKSKTSAVKSKSTKSRNSGLSQSPSKKIEFQTLPILAMHVSTTAVTDSPTADELDVDDAASIMTNISCFDVNDHHMSPKGSSAPTTSFLEYTQRYKSDLPDEAVEEMSMFSTDDEHVANEGVATGRSTRSMKKKSQVGKEIVVDVSRDPTAKTVMNEKASRWSWKKKSKVSQEGCISKGASIKTVGEKKSTCKNEDENDAAVITSQPSKEASGRKLSVKPEDPNEEPYISQEPSMNTVGTRKSLANKDKLNYVSKDASSKTVSDRRPSIEKEDITDVPDISCDASSKTVNSRKSSVKKEEEEINDEAAVFREPSSKTVRSRKSSVNEEAVNGEDCISKGHSTKVLSDSKSSLKQGDITGVEVSRGNSVKAVTSRKSSVKSDDITDLSREPSSKTVGGRKSSLKKDDLNNVADIPKGSSLRTVTSRKSSVKRDDITDLSREPSSKTVGSRKSSLKKDDINSLANISKNSSLKTVTSRKSTIKSDDPYEIASLFREQQSLTTSLGGNTSKTKSYLSRRLTKQSSVKSTETFGKQEESTSKKTSPNASFTSGKKEENKVLKTSTPKGSFASGKKSEIVAFSSVSSKPLLSQKASLSSGSKSYSAEASESVVEYNKSARSLGMNEPVSPPSEKVEGKSKRSLGKSREQLLIQPSTIPLQNQNVSRRRVLPWRPPVQFEGYLQTSIDIEQDNIQSMEFPPLEFRNHFNMRGNATITNEGYTVEMKFPDTKAPLLSGGPLFEGDYEFVGLHLHWGANDLINNHTVDGKLYDMEVHLLHILKDCGSIEKAMQLPHGFSIAAFFLEGSDDENPDFDAILTALSKITSPNAVTSVSSDVLKLLERSAQPKGYFTYPGSLSIPPYNEVVIWIFYPDPVYISHRQVAEYRKLSKLANYNMKQQFKPPQSINGKLIFHAT